jgi:hypothetical protein
MTLSLFVVEHSDFGMRLLGGGASETGVSDWRFSALGHSLGPEWPILSHSREMKSTLSTSERLTPDLVARLDADIPIEMRENEDGSEHEAIAPTPLFPAQLPDIFMQAEVVFVSRRVKEIVESFEPGRHQYFPVAFHAKDSGRRMYEEQGFHYWNVLTWVPPDLLYDFEAMNGEPGVEIAKPPPRPDYIETFRDFAAFKSRPEIQLVSIRNWNFKTWRIRPEWHGVGHAIRTGSYSASRLRHIKADSRLMISEDLRLALRSASPPIEFRATAIPFSV